MRCIFFISFLTAAFLSSCTVQKTGRILNDVETYIQIRPDSALATLRIIDPDMISSRKLRAHYSLLHAMALDKNHIDTSDRSIVMPAIKYYERYGSAEQKMKSWYYLGRIQENGGDNPSANVSFLKAERLIDAGTDDYFKAMVWIALANTCSRSYLHEDALKYGELAYRATIGIGDSLSMNATRYMMAQEFSSMKRYREADSVYQVLLHMEAPDVSQWRPTLLDDYAMLLLLSKDDCNAAVRIFDRAVRSTGSLSTANHWGAYAYALLRIGEQERSEAIFRKISAEDDKKSLWHLIWKSRAESFLTDYASAYKHIACASEIQDQTIARILQQSTLTAQRDYMEEENAALQIRAGQQRMRYWTALLGLALMSGIGFLLFVRKRRKMQAEREILLESFRAIAADRDQANDEREEVRMAYIKMCQTHFRQIGRINELLHNIVSEKDSLLYKELNKAVKSIHDDDGSHKVFENMLNETLDNVMLHYRESFPGKNERHYHLVGFIFAGFNAATIGSILCDCKKDNAYLQKTRLKKAIRESDSPYKEQFLSYIS